jgi:hypothetical protein
MAALITFATETVDVGIHLGPQCFSEHPAFALTDDLVDHR